MAPLDAERKALAERWIPRARRWAADRGGRRDRDEWISECYYKLVVAASGHDGRPEGFHSYLIACLRDVGCRLVVDRLPAGAKRRAREHRLDDIPKTVEIDRLHPDALARDDPGPSTVDDADAFDALIGAADLADRPMLRAIYGAGATQGDYAREAGTYQATVSIRHRRAIGRMRDRINERTRERMSIPCR